MKNVSESSALPIQSTSLGFNYFIDKNEVVSLDPVNFFVKGLIINIVGSVGHTISATATELCHYSLETATDAVETHECDCVPIKHYLQKHHGQNSA